MNDSAQPHDDGTTSEPGPEAEDATQGKGGRASIDIQAMLAQLQKMIDQIAAASAPALKELAAKAAELAAAAAARTGPLAHGIADQTERASHAVDDRSRRLATDLRSPASADAGPDAAPAAEAAAADAATEAAETAGARRGLTKRSSRSDGWPRPDGALATLRANRRTQERRPRDTPVVVLEEDLSVAAWESRRRCS